MGTDEDGEVQGSDDNALPVQSGVHEIQQECQPQFCDVQVTKHLGNVRLGESRYHFGVDDHRFIDDQVRDQRPDVLIFVEHWKLPLSLDSVATLPKFNDQRSLVQLLIQTGFQRVEDIHRRANDRLAQLFVYEFVGHSFTSERVTTDHTDSTDRIGRGFRLLHFAFLVDFRDQRARAKLLQYRHSRLQVKLRQYTSAI